MVTMRHFLTSLYLLGTFLHTLTKCTVSTTDFHLDGDYLIGGLLIFIMPMAVFIKQNHRPLTAPGKLSNQILICGTQTK